MKAPLYRNAPSASQHSNTGLVFDKYFASWDATFLNSQIYDFIANKQIEKYGTDKKAEWVREIVGRGSNTSPGNAAERLATLVTQLGGTVWYAVAASRFVTGTGIDNPLENGFAFHHTLGVPYLTASGLKGALRHYWTQWSGCNAGCDAALGSAKGGVGSVILFDMLPLGPVALVREVMTPHYGDWYQKGDAPGDWMSPNPIPFIAVEAGAIFQIAAAPRKFGDPDWLGTAVGAGNRDNLKDMLEKTLEVTGLGAKTAVGYGRFKLLDNQRDAQDAAKAIKDALRGTERPTNAPAVAAEYRTGQTLPAGTLLTWNASGDVFEVKTRTPLTLAPRMKIPVSFDDQDDEAPISQIVELKHIN